MRIAFTSCMFNRVFADQPVWGWIAAQAPDALVLLGDSTYFDVHTATHPRDMSDFAFAQHAYARYTEVIAQPQFAALVRSMPAGSVHAIWDDHDFLWDNAAGAEMHPVHTEKIRLSAAMLEAFRRALHQQLAPGSFPATYNDPVLWGPSQDLSTPSIALSPTLWLHLSDGRTHRTATFLVAASKRTALGRAQKDRFKLVIDAAPPDAVHLWASGSTVGGLQHFERDLDWLMGVASQRRMLVLSGDIHRNRLDAFVGNGGFALHEATSSGSAVRDGVVAGAKRQNHGLLDIDAASVTISLFKRDRLEFGRRLDIATWLPV
jgi:alkaline phosphatase D